MVTLAVASLLGVQVGACGRNDHVVARALDGGGAGQFGVPQLIDGLLDPADHVQDPTLSSDELELYFASTKNGTLDIWRSTRARADLPWQPALRVAELSSANEEQEPELTSDGLTIYFGSDRPGSVPTFRLWSSRRASRAGAWEPPQLVLLSPADSSETDRGAAVDDSHTMMVFASAPPVTDGDFGLVAVTRAAAAAPWGVKISLSSLDSAWSDWDPALFRGKLAIMFGSRRTGDHLTTDLFESARPAETAAFLPPTPVVELNSPRSEGDPWLSEDGRHVVFSSERAGTSRLYEAWR